MPEHWSARSRAIEEVAPEPERPDAAAREMPHHCRQVRRRAARLTCRCRSIAAGGSAKAHGAGRQSSFAERVLPFSRRILTAAMSSCAFLAILAQAPDDDEMR